MVDDEFFLSAELIRRLAIWEGEPPGEPNPFPTCRFADFTICRNPGSAVASPSQDLPTKVGAHVLRHQLRVKTRSMNGFGRFINYGLKSVA